MNKRIFFAPIICVILYCVCTALSFKMPFLSLLSPLLLMLFGAFALFKNSKITLGVGCVLTALVTLYINKDVAYSIVYTLGYVSAGFLLCYSILRKKGGAYALVSTAILILISDYGAVAVSDLANGKHVLSFVDEMFNTLKPFVLEAINQNAGALGIENPNQIFDVYVMAVKMMLPAIVFIIVLIKSIILSFFVKIIVNKVFKCILVDLRFSMFKADGVTVFVFLISALISMFAGDGVIAVVFGNIYMILSVVLMLCGISLLDWYLKDVQKVKTFFRFLLLLLVCASLLFPVLPMAFIVVALIDARRNFRLSGSNTKGKQN